jgi:multidrug efflux system membrane fusion protein
MRVSFSALTAGLFYCLLFSACADSQDDRQSGRRRAVPVRAAKVQRGSVDQTISVVGHVEPSAAVRVTAQVEGQLLKAHVKPGRQVKEGELLFQIDPRDFQNSLRQAEAALAGSRAQLKRAQQDLARYKSLASQNFLSQQQYEQSLTDVETLRAGIDQNTAVLESAALRLERTYIRSPISGRTGEVLVDPGNNIKANDATLLVINTISPADVRFSVPEGFLPELNRSFRQGAVDVRVLPEGDNGEPVTGRVIIIDNEVDRSTGTISMRARFENQDERLWPGQFVRVHIVLNALNDALIIPDSAVLEGLQGRYVYVLRADGGVENRNITARDLDGRRAVVLSGLTEGETVVTDGQLNLLPGSLAEVLEESGPAGASRPAPAPAPDEPL